MAASVVEDGLAHELGLSIRVLKSFDPDFRLKSGFSFKRSSNAVFSKGRANLKSVNIKRLQFHPVFRSKALYE